MFCSARALQDQFNRRSTNKWRKDLAKRCGWMKISKAAVQNRDRGKQVVCNGISQDIRTGMQSLTLGVKNPAVSYVKERKNAAKCKYVDKNNADDLEARY